VYAYIQPDGTWWINNCGFVTGPGGVIAVDSCSTEARTRQYLDGKPGVVIMSGPRSEGHFSATVRTPGTVRVSASTTCCAT